MKTSAVKKVYENGRLSEGRMEEGKRVEKKLSLKRGAWREVMKHKDVCIDPGNDELASLAFQPLFTRHFTPACFFFAHLLGARDNTVSSLARPSLEPCQILTHSPSIR